jgi:hypothetical protein
VSEQRPPEPEPPEPQADAERKLRLAMAAEKRAERDMLGRIQKGFYGCITIFVILFLIALLFF